MSRASVVMIRIVTQPGTKEEMEPAAQPKDFCSYKLQKRLAACGWPYDDPTWSAETGEEQGIFCGLTRWLQQCFRGIELAVLAGVVQRCVRIGALLAQIDFAGVEGLGIHMNADRPLVEFR